MKSRVCGTMVVSKNKIGGMVGCRRAMSRHSSCKVKFTGPLPVKNCVWTITAQSAMVALLFDPGGLRMDPKFPNFGKKRTQGFTVLNYFDSWDRCSSIGVVWLTAAAGH